MVIATEEERQSAPDFILFYSGLTSALAVPRLFFRSRDMLLYY